jgi:hypothetical protein
VQPHSVLHSSKGERRKRLETPALPAKGLELWITAPSISGANSILGKGNLPLMRSCNKAELVLSRTLRRSRLRLALEALKGPFPALIL